MKKLAGLIGTIILVIWQLPQVVVGFFARLFTRAQRCNEMTYQKHEKGLLVHCIILDVILTFLALVVISGLTCVFW